ncbi:hypothetical protein DUF421 [Gottschalkia acidurici 9a]|uniref:DUF421 domain-containing protein n=1 Tax=Gottschalkia acidurici (strain ATCC 7906 / DSM 604 / BCRC 14475 / CIP 104303 / KCTC 5404 / NCIMB 10678 / 9a) TaxID=1128398 RepID=K0AYP1_GOTA9|nr:DUF421 domain-containing protein [Gottschalkia acidurici]AFS77845.1 hypothetical protein DUF421 [Gottschalkia acidurici 9a]
MNVGYLKIALETTITFFILLLLTRFLGKKQLSHLTFFNYITGITIGSIAANMVILDTKSYMKELTSLVIWCILTVIIGYIGLKSPKMRILLDGEPTILVKKGVIDKRALHLARLNLDDLTMLIRQRGVFSINEVDYAILEPNGTISILKKMQYQSAQKSDLELISSSEIKHIPTEIITDGSLVKKNLRELGLTRAWLNKELSKLNIKSINEVFYAEIQSDGSLYIQRND